MLNYYERLHDKNTKTQKHKSTNKKEEEKKFDVPRYTKITP